jgi:hypothetical protein
MKLEGMKWGEKTRAAAKRKKSKRRAA